MNTSEIHLHYKCGLCPETAEVTPQMMDEIGTPICPETDDEMFYVGWSLPTQAGMPKSFNDMSLAERVIPVDALRAESEDDPNLSDAERALLKSATDEQAKSALDEAWSVVEETFFSLHDELQEQAKYILFHNMTK